MFKKFVPSIYAVLLAVFAALLAIDGKAAPGPNCPQNDNDDRAWAYVVGRNDPLIYLEYLKRFPNGCYREEAKIEIEWALPAEPIALRAVGKYFRLPGLVEAGNGQVLTKNNAMITRMSYSLPDFDTAKLRIEYQCDAAGIGLSGWGTGDVCHPQAEAKIQGFQLRLAGIWTDFYDLILECSNSDGANFRAENGQWCGNHAGEGQKFITNLRVTIRRKPIVP